MQTTAEIEVTIRQALTEANRFLNAPESLELTMHSSIAELAKLNQQLTNLQELHSFLDDKVKALQVKLSDLERREKELQENANTQLAEIARLGQKKNKLDLVLQELELSYMLKRLETEEEQLKLMLASQQQIVAALQQLSGTITTTDKAVWDAIPQKVTAMDLLRTTAAQEITGLRNKNVATSALLNRLDKHSHPYVYSGHHAHVITTTGVPRKPRPKV